MGNRKRIEDAHVHKWAIRRMRGLLLNTCMKWPESEASKLHDAFRNFKDEILHFAHRSEVPFTNSRVEQGIRMAKVKLSAVNAFQRL